MSKTTQLAAALLFALASVSAAYAGDDSGPQATPDAGDASQPANANTSGSGPAKDDAAKQGGKSSGGGAAPASEAAPETSGNKAAPDAAPAPDKDPAPKQSGGSKLSLR